MKATEPIPEAPLHEAHDCLGHDQRCPLCARENDCRVAKGHLYKGPCWCHQVIVPGHILTRLADEAVDPACLCRFCLETIARISRDLDSAREILAEVRRVIPKIKAEQTVAPEPDFYLDEQGNTVFTAAYHVKRGTCCRNGCVHCPY